MQKLSAASLSKQQFSEFLGRLYGRPASAVGVSLFLLFLLVAIFAGLLAPYNINEQIYTAVLQAPSRAHWFGTDNLGRDVYSRVLYGAREVLLLAGAGTILSLISGAFFGLTSGYLGGWFDQILMRLFDGLLAIPALLLALLLLGAAGTGSASVLIVIVIVYTPIVARVVRSVVLTIKPLSFIEAARLRGESLRYILLREIFPLVLPALTVEGALRFSYAIFLVASLGFLGIGVQPPSPNWGLMVNEGRNFVNQAPWMLFFPAAAIALLVIGVNLMADGIKRGLQREG